MLIYQSGQVTAQVPSVRAESPNDTLVQFSV